MYIVVVDGVVPIGRLSTAGRHRDREGRRGQSVMPHGAPIQLPRWAVKVQGRGNTTRPGYRLGPPWAARHASTRQKVCPVIPLALLLWCVLAGVTDRRVGGGGGAERAGTSYPTLTLLFDCLIRVGVNHS